MHRGQAVTFRSRQDERGIAAVVLVHGAVGDLPGRRGDFIEEPTVVGHHQQRARPRCQVRRQPVDRIHVEMVGRLVEEQQLRLGQQRPGQRDPPSFSTRERSDRRVQTGPEAAQLDSPQQAVEHPAEGSVSGPLVLGAAADQRLADRVVPLELIALGQQHGLHIPGPGHHPRVGRLHARDQPEQGRLAAAVATHHADAVAGAHAQTDLGQHRPGPVPLVDRVEVDEIARAGAQRRSVTDSAGSDR